MCDCKQLELRELKEQLPIIYGFFKEMPSFKETTYEKMMEYITKKGTSLVEARNQLINIVRDRVSDRVRDRMRDQQERYQQDYKLPIDDEDIIEIDKVFRNCITSDSLRHYFLKFEEHKVKRSSWKIFITGYVNDIISSIVFFKNPNDTDSIKGIIHTIFKFQDLMVALYYDPIFSLFDHPSCPPSIQAIEPLHLKKWYMKNQF